VDLTAVPGVNTQTVQDFIGEVGPDLLRRLARIDQYGSAELTHSKNGTGNGSKIRESSSTPKAWFGGSG
jgi:hypothetical protein